MEDELRQLPQNRTSNKKTVVGILVALVAYIIIGSVGLYLLNKCWTEYAIASKDKSYTFEMLLSRLSVGVLASIIAGIIATRITCDKGQAAWLAGIIILCVAVYIHVFRVWAEYPAWYHAAYLLPIIPVTGLSHYFISKWK